MSDVIILILGQTPEDPVRWAVMSGREIRSAGDGSMAVGFSDALYQAPPSSLIVAVLPGEAAAMRAVPSPPRVAAKFRAAAAYLIEDDLAENLDCLHVATARHESGAGLAVAVKTSVMDAWREAFGEAGFTPDIMTPDFALLPLQADNAVIVIDHERITGAMGLQGFAAERTLAETLISALTVNDAIDKVIAYGDRENTQLNFSGKHVDWNGRSDDATLFGLFVDQAVRSNAPNLLQGEYRKRLDWRGALGSWRRAALLAIVSVVGLAGVTIADAARSDRLAQQLTLEAAALHMTAFPSQANANPREHARQVLASGTGGPAFLRLSTQFADSLAETNKIQVDRVRYNATRGEFSINLRFSDINDLETLKRSLANRGVVASETGGVLRSGGFYVGELRVSN